MHINRPILLLILVTAFAGCGNDQSDFEALRKREQQLQQAKANKPAEGLTEQLESVNQELKVGSPKRAVEMSRALLLQHPSNEEVLLIAAKAQAADGDKAGAAKVMQSIVSDNIDQMALWALQASNWLVQSNQYADAIDGLSKFVERYPDQSRVRRELAVLLNQSGLRLEAAEHLYWLLKTKGLGEKELFALISLRKALIDTTFPAPSANSLDPVLLSQAMSLRDDGNLSKAFQLASSLSKKHPENSNIVAFTGRLLSEMDKWEQWRQWHDDIQVDLTSQPDYWYSVGLAQYRQDRYQESVRCFAECLLLDATDRDAAIHFARALDFVGDTATSKQALFRHQKLDRIAWLASDFGLEKGTTEQYQEVADALDALGRPWEAIGWRAISRGSSNDDKAKADRERLTKEQAVDPALAICGLDLNELPLPEFSKIEVAASSPKSSSSVQAIKLRDITSSLGIDFQYLSGDDPNDDQLMLHQQTGGGIAAIDFDLDGWQDLYFAQAGGAANQNDSAPDQVYRNLACAEFRLVTQNTGIENLGYGQGVDVADLNQDGFADILVANVGLNLIWMNNGDGTFTKAEHANGSDESWTTSIASGDLDGDHLPEIIQVNYIDDPTVFETSCLPTDGTCGPSRFRPAADQWLSVNSDGRIAKWEAEPDQTKHLGHGFAAIITNIDKTRGNDVYVANDADSNWFWKSSPWQKDVSDSSPVSESGQLSGCVVGEQGGHHGSMGLAAADWDRNGALDLHVTNYWEQEADFYLQIKKGVFQHASRRWKFADVTKPTVGWGTQAIDLNQDGWDDLVVLNGHIVDQTASGVPFKMVPQVFVSAGGQWNDVTTMTAKSDPYWSSAAMGRALCRVDIDRDGRSDLVAGHLDRPIAVLRNETPGRNWIRFTLIGVESERDAIGARIEVKCGQQTFVGWQIGGGGFLCDNQSVVEFGLGDCQTLTSVEVVWPSGQKQRFNNVKSSKHYQVVEGQSLMQVDWSVVSALQ